LNKILKCFFLFIGFTSFCFTNVIGQRDSIKVAITPTTIDDTTFVQDSILSTKKSGAFIMNQKTIISDGMLFSFSLTKKKFDFIDYKYSGDILLHLPFGSLNNLGYSGAPNEPNIYSFGYGNISLNINENSVNNKWNNSSELNRVQTEDIYSINIIPLSRTFLYGIGNNPAAINIITRDSIKSKPISRIRYYQAPNDEGFIDAMFSARVLSKLALAFRVTNIGSQGNFSNTNHESWKANVKGIYKFSDNLFAKINYYHVKSETGLYGGINVSSPFVDIYNQFAQINFNKRFYQTTIHDFNTSIYGALINNNYTKLIIGQNYNSNKFKQNIDNDASDSTKISNENKYKTLFATLTTEQKFGNLNLKLSSGYEEIDFNIDDIGYNKKQSNYYVWLIAQYGFFNNSLIPSIFGKLSEADSQKNNGFGVDLSFKINQSLKLFVGLSNFDKPYSIIEKQTLSTGSGNLTQSFNTQFVSLEFLSTNFKASLSYFNVESSNSLVPVFSDLDVTLNTSEIIFNNVENINSSGINILSDIKLWKILTSINFNYYWQSEDPLIPKSSKYHLNVGVYYVDTLFKSNLNLKTGFMFYLNDNSDFKIYDFQKLRSTSHYVSQSSVLPFQSYDISNNPYRLDFFLSGRIQNLATFYFVYENILAHNYYIVPYYPMPDGGIKIGISWDFLD